MIPSMNPYVPVARKFLYDLVPQKFKQHEEILERIILTLNHKKDIEGFLKLLADVYETGFNTSVEQHKSELTRLGLKVQIVASKPTEEQKIFNQKSQDDL